MQTVSSRQPCRDSSSPQPTFNRAGHCVPIVVLSSQAFSKTLISWSKCSPSWFLASRDANGDGHEPRDGNRDCDPKYRVFEHPCEIPRFGHLRASICNYRHLYARRQLWANGTIAASRVSRALVCGPGCCAWSARISIGKARSGSDSCFD